MSFISNEKHSKGAKHPGQKNPKRPKDRRRARIGTQRPLRQVWILGRDVTLGRRCSTVNKTILWNVHQQRDVTRQDLRLFAPSTDAEVYYIEVRKEGIPQELCVCVEVKRCVLNREIGFAPRTPYPTQVPSVYPTATNRFPLGLCVCLEGVCSFFVACGWYYRKWCVHLVHYWF